MSLDSITSGDTVVVQNATISDFSEEAWEDGEGLDCHVQQQQAAGSQQHGTRGEVRYYKAFFSFDPQLSAANRLKWTQQGGAELSTPKILRVIDTYSRARPGEEPMFWVADCEDLTNRREE